jgi:hypothetical protein
MVVLMALGLVAGAEAAASKKGRKKSKKRRVATAHVARASSGPFADVPLGHWAYQAVSKAVETGILQGWENKYHGTKVVNRYQMAVIVARMIDRLGVLKASGRIFTAQDVANLEQLTIEFADELALLNVKVNNLEDKLAAMRKDVDWLKAELGAGGAKAGITGTAQARWAFTDDITNGYRFGPFAGPPAILPGLGVVTAGTVFTPTPAATSPVTRYRGQQVSGTGVGQGTTAGVAPAVGAAPFQYDARDFFTVSNFSINFDRNFDPRSHFHAQVDINAEGANDATNTANSAGAAFAAAGAPSGATGVAGTPVAGRGASFTGLTVQDIHVNEAYVVFDDWFSSSPVAGRIGIWAVPMNFEVNGPSRTYQWTITPSIANSKWESIRPLGLDIFQHTEKEQLLFYIGFFTPGDTSASVFRSGTLLSQNTGFGFGAPAGAGAGGGTAQTDPAFITGVPFAFNPGGTVAAPAGSALGRFPTPMGFPAMTDAPRGVTNQTLASDDIGWYVMVGSHPTGADRKGLTWHAAYHDRNGELRPGLNETISLTDWYAWQVAGSYQWEKLTVAGQYYDATSKNYNFADLGLFLTPGSTSPDPRRINSTPFANVAARDTESDSWMALFNWQFNNKGSVTMRYERADDTTGNAKIEADVWTYAFNWRSSDHGWFQLEWIDPSTRTTSENGFKNTIDISDDLVQANYKFTW